MSSIILEDLQREIGGQNNAVVSLFLHDGSGIGTGVFRPPFAASALREVIRQLAPRSSGALSTGADLRETVAPLISSFDCVFLVVDDIDLLWCDPDGYLEFEAELSWLQDRRVKILTTSRVPFHKTTVDAVCDIFPDEHHDLDVWWQCQRCLDQDFYICDDCKEAGHGCRTE